MANHNSRFFFDEQSQENAKIKVIGVGAAVAEMLSII